MTTAPSVVAVKESREFIELRQLRALHTAAFGSDSPASSASSVNNRSLPSCSLAECSAHVAAARLFASAARTRLHVQQEVIEVQAAQARTWLQLQREEMQCWCSIMLSWTLLFERELRALVESELAYFHRFASQNEPQWRQAAMAAQQQRVACELDRQRIDLQRKLIDVEEDARQDKHMFFDEARDWLTAMKFMEEDERQAVIERVAKARTLRPSSSSEAKATCPASESKKPNRGGASVQPSLSQQHQQQQPAYGYYSAAAAAHPQGPATRPVAAWSGSSGAPQAGIPLAAAGGGSGVGSATMAHYPTPQNLPQYAVPRPQYGAPQYYDPSRTANYTATNGTTAYNNFGIAQYPGPSQQLQPQQQQQPYSGLSTYRYPTSSQYAAPPSLAHPR